VDLAGCVFRVQSSWVVVAGRVWVAMNAVATSWSLVLVSWDWVRSRSKASSAVQWWTAMRMPLACSMGARLTSAWRRCASRSVCFEIGGGEGGGVLGDGAADLFGEYAEQGDVAVAEGVDLRAVEVQGAQADGVRAQGQGRSPPPQPSSLSIWARR
jgi:hypothetical protein